MLIRTLFFIVAIFLTGLTASNATAASITLASADGSVYQLVGNGFSKVSALNVTIKYDPSSLEAPKISQGPLANGTLFVANPYTPGEVKIAFVHASGVTGTGSIAEIVFTSKGSSGGGITGMTAQTLDPKGQILPVTAAVSNFSGSSMTAFPNAGSPQTSGAGGATTSPASGVTGTGGTAYLGAVTLPGEDSSGREKQVRESAENPAVQPAATPALETVKQEPAPESTPPVQLVKRPTPIPPANTLERFKAYNEALTLEGLKQLFANRGGDWIAQIPPIAPADGKSLITLQLSTELFYEKAPNFSLRGVEMKRVTSSENGWAIEIIPAKDSMNSSISIVVDRSVVEVPLLTVPALPKSWDTVKLTRSEVNLFLADRSVKRDLNGDGRHDYKDDYIMVGNYLLQENPAEGEKTGSVK